MIHPAQSYMVPPFPSLSDLFFMSVIQLLFLFLNIKGTSINSETLGTTTKTFRISSQYQDEHTPVVAFGRNCSNMFVVWRSGDDFVIPHGDATHNGEGEENPSYSTVVA